MYMVLRSLAMADVYGIEMIICGRCVWYWDNYLWQMCMVLRWLSVADVYGIEMIICGRWSRLTCTVVVVFLNVTDAVEAGRQSGELCLLMMWYIHPALVCMTHDTTSSAPSDVPLYYYTDSLTWLGSTSRCLWGLV